MASTRAHDPISFAVTLAPAQAGRPVRIEQFLDGSWVVLGSGGAVDATGATTLTAAALGYPTWLRVTAPAWEGHGALSVAAVRTFAERTPTAIAHRAGAGVAPEQTVGAVETAVAAGAESMEIDVQLTSDGEPIIVHDADFKRTTDVEEVFPADADKAIGEFTLAQVKQLDAGSWFGPQWAGEEIPTLDEAIAALGPDTHLVLEVKSPEVPGNTPDPGSGKPGIADVLATELASGPLGDLAADGRLTVSSFGLTWLEEFATTHPDVPVGALTVFAPTVVQLDQWSGWAEEVHGQVGLMTPAAVAATHARGMTVSVWTANDPAQLRRALVMDADGVITDYTARFADVLNPPAPPA